MIDRSTPACIAAFALALLLATGMLFPLSLHAQSSISVLENAHTYEFKGPLTFRLVAQSDAEISEVRLYYRTWGQTAAHRVDPAFTPGTTVEVEHTEDMDAPDNYQPPMVSFTYWWVIEDKAGNKLKTDQASFVYEDTRYTWDSLEDERVRVYWHDQDAAFGQHYFDLASRSAEQVAAEFHVEIEHPVSIVIYNSHEELMSVLHEASAEWTGAVNFGDTGTIAIGLGSRSWMDRVIPHELTHAMLNQVTQPPFGDIPRWLHEGLAMRSEGGMSPEERSALDDAIANDTLISLRVLNSPFPDQRERAILSYAESNSLVEFIIAEYGPDKLGELIEVFAQGAHYDDAMQQVFGVDMDGMEDLWRAHIGAPPRQGVTRATPAARDTALPALQETNTPSAASTSLPVETAVPATRSRGSGLPCCPGALSLAGVAALFALVRLRPTGR